MFRVLLIPCIYLVSVLLVSICILWMQTKWKPLIREREIEKAKLKCVYLCTKIRLKSAWYLIQIEIYLFCYWINKLSKNNRFDSRMLFLFFVIRYIWVVCICAGYIFLFLDNIFLDIWKTSLPFVCSLWNGINAIFFIRRFYVFQ